MNEKLYPAALCAIATRTVRLRNKVKSLPLSIQSELAEFIAVLPFEAELLSGKMVEVEKAIEGIGTFYAGAEQKLLREVAELKKVKIRLLERQVRLLTGEINQHEKDLQ